MLPAAVHVLVEFAKSLPLIGTLVAALVILGITWVLAHPLDASKQFWRFLSFVFGYFGRRYAKAAVEKDANEFFGKKLAPGVGIAPLPKLMVDFVASTTDARLRSDGHIVVRMRKERDQSRNVLSAVRAAIQHLLYPHARAYLHKPLVSAVDLEVLQLLANMLGSEAQTMYSTEILTPRTQADPELPRFLSVVQDIEKGGLFGNVLINELADLSNRLKASHPSPEVASETLRLVAWLEQLATRPPGDESPSLIFIGKEFKLAFILAAKAATAAKGVGPYHRRLGIDLLQGAQNIYVLGLTAAHRQVCEAIGEAFDADPRVKRMRTTTVVVERDGREQRLTLIRFQRNQLYMSDASFSTQLADCGIRVGEAVTAQVRGFTGAGADVTIGTLDARLAPPDCAWGYRGSASRFVNVAEAVPVVIKAVDDSDKRIDVRLKQHAESNWSAATLPAQGDRVRGIIEEDCGGSYVVRVTEFARRDGGNSSRSSGNFAKVDSLLYGRILANEWSWYAHEDSKFVPATTGAVVESEVIVAEPNREDLLLSRRNLEVRDWETAKRRFPKGTATRARVLSVSPEGLVFEIEPGLFGRIPAYKVRAQGFELADYENTVVPGAQYDVVVEGVKERRKDFRLEFARRP